MRHAGGRLPSVVGEYNEVTTVATIVEEVPPLLDALEAGGVNLSARADMVRYGLRWIIRLFLNDAFYLRCSLNLDTTCTP